MANPLQQAGALSEPSNFAPIHTNRMFTGLWTQRSPLRDAAVPYLYEKFYAGSRFDSLIDGLNAEITPRLTWARRAGHTQYNTQSFPAVRRFFPFRRKNADNSANIKVIADCDSFIYDATGPSTKTQLLAKAAGAGRTSFLGLLNTLYMGDGAEQKKWVSPALAWAAATAFTVGQYIVDTNFNLQQVTTAGTSGGGAPAWNAAVRGTTADNTVTWTNRGSAVDGWGTAQPTTALTVAAWQAGHAYSVGDLVFGPALDSQIQECTTAGVSGGGAPAWNTVQSGTTADNTVTWTNRGPATVSNSFSGAMFVSLGTGLRAWYPGAYITQYYAIVDSNGSLQVALIAAMNTGLTGPPNWNSSPGQLTGDGTGFWTNAGKQSAWVKSTSYAQTTWLVDPAGNIQMATALGVSGAAAPAWAAGLGAATVDNTVTWTNCGPATQPVFGGYEWGFSYHTVEGEVSPMSAGVSVGAVMGATIGGTVGFVLGGMGTAQANVDKIYIWRTVDGGSTLLKLAEINNPGAALWTYTDVLADSALNELIQADVTGINTPPPAGLINQVLHLGIIFGSVGSTVYYSRNAGAIAGSPYSGFPPNNYFDFPAQVTRLYSCTLGLLVFTTEDIYLLGGQNTASNPLYPVLFAAGWGLLSADCFTVHGGTPYLYTSRQKVISLDPGAGVVEVSFPIGDQLKYLSTGNNLSLAAPPLALSSHIAPYVGWAPGTYRVRLVNTSVTPNTYSQDALISVVGARHGITVTMPDLTSTWDIYISSDGWRTARHLSGVSGVATFDAGTGSMTAAQLPPGLGFDASASYLTWHEENGNDSGLVLSDGRNNWFRMTPVSAPESGFVWSPLGTMSTIQGNAGIAAAQSIETLPGLRQLLVWQADGLILYRNADINVDGPAPTTATPPASFPAWVRVGSIVLAQPGQVAEIEFIAVDSMRTGSRVSVGLLLDEISGTFETLPWSKPDPPLLPASASVFNDRFYAQQSQDTTQCRHLQLQFTWAAEDAHNELLSYTIFGAVYIETRSQ